MMHAPKYIIVQNAKLFPARRREDDADVSLPGLFLLPVNVVHIKCADGRPETSASFICESFDLTMCSVCLHVHENLHYSTSGFNGSAEALLKKKLRLSPCAFYAGPGKVQIQMVRIRKYLERGFDW